MADEEVARLEPGRRKERHGNGSTIMRKIKKLDERSGIYQIGPEEAESILATPGARNRPVSLARVIKYAGRMKSGHWRLTGEPVILDQQGRLLDGQHRLRAIIEAGKEVETVVLYGEFLFGPMGQSAFRSGGDSLHIAMPDLIHVNALSAAAGLCIKYERALKRETSPYSQTRNHADNWADIDNQDRTTWVRKNPRLLEILQEVSSLSHGDRTLMPASQFSAGWFLIESAAGAEAAKDFMVPLITGVGLKAGDVRLTMRRALANHAAASNGQVRGMEAVHWISKAWNTRDEAKKPTSTFAVKATESFPFIR